MLSRKAACKLLYPVFESCRPRAKVVLVVPMEIILPMLLVAFAAWAFLTLLAIGIAHGNGKMESEDFPSSKPTAKLVRKVDGKTPTPEQTTVKSETVKTSEKIVVSSQGLSGTTYVSPHMDFFQGHGGYESEDEAQYRQFNPTPAEAVSPPDLGQDKSVYSVMQIRECHCFQTQTVDQVREIMRERDLPYLVVLDQNRHIVGMVTMRDLDKDEKQSPFA